MKTIVQSPNKVLSDKANPVIKIDKSIKHLLKEMRETLLHASDPEGVGLAAPQIGKSLQIFIIKQSSRSPILTFINPEIESFIEKEPEPEIKQSEKTTKAKKKAGISKGVQLEGCLSIKDIWGVVHRKPGVVLSYQDETGKEHKKTFDGFMAVIVQHEYDHLQGVLFPKRVLEQDNQLYRSVKNRQGETEFEEIKI